MFDPTAVMRFPSTTTTAFRISVSDVPSNSRAAFTAIVCAEATEAKSVSARKSFFMRVKVSETLFAV